MCLMIQSSFVWSSSSNSLLYCVVLLDTASKVLRVVALYTRWLRQIKLVSDDQTQTLSSHFRRQVSDSGYLKSLRHRVGLG